MRHYEIRPHTADIRLKIEGSTLKELFMSALEGMAEILKPGFCKNKSSGEIKETIEISAPDLTSLLIDFLSAVLTLSYERRAVFCGAVFCAVKFANVAEKKEYSIQARIFGSKVNEFDEDIKAVTYHDAEVRKNKKGDYEIIITLDI